MNMMRSAVFAVLAFGPAAAFAQMSDADILNKIHSINQEEIGAAALAQKSSTNADVKKFAARMTKDHTKADGDVAMVAQKKGITLADATPGPDPLAQMSGADFDRGYATKMADGHADALKFLAKADAATTDADVKKLVEKLQPAVAHHEKMAKSLKAKLSSTNVP